MKTTPDQLINRDPEDIADCFPKIEASFGFRFEQNDITENITFGQLCVIVTARMNTTLTNDSTEQQAFYQIRQVIAHTLSIDKNTITPSTLLEMLIPRPHRRKIVRYIEKKLGIPMDILGPTHTIRILLVLLLLASLIELFIRWKYGLIALAATFLCWKLADWTAKEFDMHTVGELAARITKEHYRKSRRDADTANEQEIIGILKTIFAESLSLDPSVLTLDAPLFKSVISKTTSR